MDPQDFKLLKGEEDLALYKEPNTTSGQVFEGYSCKHCASFIHTTSDTMRKDGQIIVSSGTLDDPLAWKPTAEFYCMRRPDWLPPSGIKTFPKMPWE